MDIDNDIILSNTSRKRPYNSDLSSMSSSSKVKSEMSAKNTNTDQSNANTNNTIDGHKVWQELTTFIPLLTYGEESSDLLNSLLCLPFGLVVRDAEDCVGSVSSSDCKRDNMVSSGRCAQTKRGIAIQSREGIEQYATC